MPLWILPKQVLPRHKLICSVHNMRFAHVAKRFVHVAWPTQMRAKKSIIYSFSAYYDLSMGCSRKIYFYLRSILRGTSLYQLRNRLCDTNEIFLISSRQQIPKYFHAQKKSRTLPGEKFGITHYSLLTTHYFDCIIFFVALSVAVSSV